jgi:hypothetical protein|tara:strand:+ start:4010 stop:4249 length:240 start_codon:yes stop_codon:yes gene_type:complete
METPDTLSIDKMTAAFHAAIDSGAWKCEDGICGHCYNCGDVFLANRNIFSFQEGINTAPVCMECLIHRSLWNTYLETSA